MKTIVFFIEDITRIGGTEKAISLIANGLTKTKNYKVIILSIYKSNEEVKFEFEKNIEFEFLLEEKIKGLKKYFLILMRLSEILNRNYVDILISSDALLTLYCLLPCKLRSVLYITWDHLNFQENLGLKSRSFGRYLSAKFADKVITLTKNNANCYIERFKTNNIVVIPNAFVRKTEDTQSLNLPSNYLLSVGRLVPEKGFDLLLKTAKYMSEIHKDWKWLILGDGPEHEKLIKLTRDYKLEDFVIFMGYIKDVYHYYKNAYLYIMTSKSEAFPLVLLEAKAEKIPIVTFKVNEDIPDIVLNDLNGYVVEKGNIIELAKKILELLANKDKREYFSENSQIGMDEFKFESVINQWGELLLEMTESI